MRVLQSRTETKSRSRDEASQRDGLASAIAKRATLPRRRTFHFEAHRESVNFSHRATSLDNH